MSRQGRMVFEGQTLSFAAAQAKIFPAEGGVLTCVAL